MCSCVSFSVMAGKVIMTRKKKFKLSVSRVRDRYYDQKKKSSSRDFYAKLNVSNLNVTNLY